MGSKAVEQGVSHKTSLPGVTVSSLFRVVHWADLDIVAPRPPSRPRMEAEGTILLERTLLQTILALTVQVPMTVVLTSCTTWEPPKSRQAPLADLSRKPGQTRCLMDDRSKATQN